MSRSYQDLRGAVAFVTLGCLLTVGLLLKSYNLLVYPTSSLSYWGNVVLISFEVHLATWLIVIRSNIVTWWVALFTFLVFCCVSAVEWLAGADSCGCFGAVNVQPLTTLWIDSIAVLSLLTCRPAVGLGGYGWRHHRDLLPYTLGACVAVAAVSFAVQQRFSRFTLTNAGLSPFVLLEPEEWTGQNFPLLSHVQIGADLSRGEWNLLLYHSDCHVCHHVMQTIEHMLLSGHTSTPIALIAVDQPIEDSLLRTLKASGCEIGALAPDKEWFVTTPVRVWLRDGICLQSAVINEWLPNRPTLPQSRMADPLDANRGHARD